MSSKTPRVRPAVDSSARLEESEESAVNLHDSIKTLFNQVIVLQEEVTYLRSEKDRLNQAIIDLSRDLDEKSTNQVAGGPGDTLENAQEHQQLFQDDNTSSAGTMHNQDAKVGVTTQAQLLAEAIRISTLPCPTLETNDRQSIKKFILKMEEYKMLGGKRTMSSLIKPRIVETLVDKFNLDPEEFLNYSDDVIEEILCTQFHSKNGFAWNEEIQRVKLRKSRDYSYGCLRDYIEDFRFAMKFAGNAHAPHVKSIIKSFLRGLEDERFSAEVERQNPTTLDMAIRSAEMVRSTLSDYHQMSKAFQDQAIDSSKKSGRDSSLQTKPALTTSSKLTAPRKVSEKWCTFHKSDTHNTEDCYALKKGAKDTLQPKSATQNKPDSSPGKTIVPSWNRKPSAKRVQINSLSALQDDAGSELHREIVKITNDLDYEWANAFEVQALLDSGCTHNLIHESVFTRIRSNAGVSAPADLVQIQLNEATSGDQTREMPYLIVQIKFNLGGVPVTVKTQVLVVDNLNEECIIGLPVLKQYGLLTYIENPESWMRLRVPVSPEEENEIPFSDIQFLDASTDSRANLIESSSIDVCSEFTQLHELVQILNKFEYQFRPLTSSDCLNVPPMQITLRDGAHLRNQAPRRVSDSVREMIKTECKRLLDLGFIVESLSEVTCPVVPVIQNGKFRLCNDYRELNEFTVPIRFPIPLIENSLRKFQNLQWKIKLDMIKSFNQILLDDSSRYLTAFTTLDGEYEWTRVPFGLRNSPSYLNYVMKEIVFRGLGAGVECFFDDILIAGETPEILLSRFTEVMQRAKDYNLHFNLDKCKFGYSTVSYLGHMLTADGIYMSEDRKLAIDGMTSPKTKKELQRFLGVINYFHKFIPDYATLSAPLSAMTGATKVFEWSPELEEYFQKLKLAVKNSNYLYFIDYNLPVVLRVDASQYGVGGILLNIKEREERFLECISHTFSEAARKWSTYEQEAYAIYYCVIKLQTSLLGIHFTLETDHRNLLWLDKASAPKVIRWRLRLQEFDFHIVHIPGRSNVVADYLSRVSVRQAEVENGEANHKMIIERYHNSIVGHHGELRTFKLLRADDFVWPQMKQDIHEFVSSCPICQKIRDMNYKFSSHFGKLPYFAPGEAIFSDGLGPFPVDEFGNKFIIVMISSGDHYVSLYPVPSLDAINTVNCLLREFGSTGCPRVFWSDQGSNYTSKVIKDFCKYFEIDQKFSLPYRPQANSIVERCNREILKHLRAIVLDKQVLKSWSLYLPMIQYIINSSYLHDVGTTAMRMRFGDSVSSTTDFEVKKNEELENAEAYVQKLNEQLYNVLSASINHSNRIYKASAFTNNPIDINVGDYVLVSYPEGPPTKLTPVYRGPMLVLEKIRDEGYLCQDIITQSQLQVSNDRIKRFKLPPEYNKDNLVALAAADHDEFIVEKILDMRGDPKRKKSLEFLVKWHGYDDDENTWEPWSHVRHLKAMDEFLHTRPDMNVK
jgi:hypothetical protein